MRIIRLFITLLFIIYHRHAAGAVPKQPANTSHGSITDISAEAIQYEKGTLQLHIAWQSMNLQGAGIDIRVKPLPNEFCSSKICSAYDVSLASKEAWLPLDPLPLVEHSECSIEPGCSYEIHVETSDRKVRGSINYTVPECISGVCSCKHASKLPHTKVTATVENNELRIYWNVTGYDAAMQNDIFFDTIDISVGVGSNPALTWGGQYKNITEVLIPFDSLNETSVANGTFVVPLNETPLPNTRFLIRAKIIDTKGCHGEEGNFTYIVPGRANAAELAKNIEENYKWIFNVLFPLLFFVLVSAFVFSFRHIFIRMRKAETNQNYLHVSYNSHTNRQAIIEMPMLENHHYADNQNSFEVPRESVELERIIGYGAFGVVCHGRVYNLHGRSGWMHVAIKTLRPENMNNDDEPDEYERERKYEIRKDFLDEINLMKSLPRHPNVLTLLGCCTQDVEKPVYMVLEYVGNGDLLQYLRNLRNYLETRSTKISQFGNVSMNPITTNQTDDRNLLDLNSTSSLLPNGMSSMNSSNGRSNSTNDTLNSIITQIAGEGNIENPTKVCQYLQLLHNATEEDAASDEEPYETDEDNENKSAMSDEKTWYTSTINTFMENCVLSPKELCDFAIQIARGMRHLERHKIVHRDLAARNILITSRKTLKISDFGLSRTGVYVQEGRRKLPLRWMSPEALHDHVFTNKSDVWSFSVVLYEIGTLGGIPYPAVQNEELKRYLDNGCRLQCPDHISKPLYDLMTACWEAKPEKRPSFKRIIKYLNRVEETTSIYTSFERFNPMKFPPQELLRPENIIAENSDEDTDDEEFDLKKKKKLKIRQIL